MSRILRDQLVLNYEGAYVVNGYEGDDDNDDDQSFIHNDEAPMPMPCLNYERSASQLLVAKMKGETNATWHTHPTSNAHYDDDVLVMPTINFEHEFEQRQTSRSGGGGGQRVDNSDPYGDDTPLIPPSLF